MSSLVPLQDLNLLPQAPDSSSSASSMVAKSVPTLICPKIEPKTEPFDEPAPRYWVPQNPNTNLLPSTPQAPFPNRSNPDIPSQPEPLNLQSVSSSNDVNVYTEFARISEMFRSAFQQQTRPHGETEVLDPSSGAIIPVPASSDNNAPLKVAIRCQKRSAELVRILNLGPEDQMYFQQLVRETRVLYDSLRISEMFGEEKRVGPGMGRRVRGDLRAASLMKDRGLWLNRDKRIVGTIPGVHVGDLFFFRMELCVVGMHGQTQAGIDYLPSSQSTSGEPIATSIIVSGGYEDDEDSGEVLVYTGHGGQDKFNRQCSHQKLEGGNLALERSMRYGIEIRVIRGFKYEGSLTTKVYVYDGLYKITNTWFDVGKSGFGVYKFRLIRMEGQPEMGSNRLKYALTLKIRPLQLRPKGYLTLDMSQKKEKVPIFLYNDIDSDHDPMCFEYLERAVFPSFIYHTSGNVGGCTCVGGCTDGCLCSMKNGGEIGYDHNGYLLRGKPLIFECGPSCHCPPTCRNRVSQRGLSHRLEVFRSRETGWGVRTLDLIHAGSFICEYSGVVLTKEQAQLLSIGGDTLIYPGRFAARWAEWGDLSKVYSNYVKPSYPSLPPLDYAMDVSRMRNVACYIGHSTYPNVMVQFVLYDHNNMMFPRMMLFALENIPPMKLLSIDYGVPDEYTGKLSICYR